MILIVPMGPRVLQKILTRGQKEKMKRKPIIVQVQELGKSKPDGTKKFYCPGPDGLAHFGSTPLEAAQKAVASEQEMRRRI
ncbi:MAG: hypothetical protein A3A08_00745 [Candidatus Nealsonbacteria bacterium RIFCSPLOWO2_01_FULL_41_9]|uniref:Uncharacterized protein n=1 Tax=Candidatus Nealsonbacteria bacterium RIFCSPLOWO2_01_FULL_41_9 TaxID=1801671 RepID=A0A1G2EB72_9BACT|nr:MAG: hypothetical protein A3A08_00745 [Candidatus Nealsonbacteria bacterium RIFCSPLOWO2_01_FULL_41_9]